MNQELATISMYNLPAINSLDTYIQAVKAMPVLAADEEKQLALHLRDDNDLEAARHLVVSHLRFVVHIARGYGGYGLPLGDLIQEGNIGLMKAVRRFDPDMNVRLVSFAVHWIRAEIHEFVLRNWRIVRVATTKAQRKLFFNLRSAKKRLGWFNRQEVETVAKELDVSPEVVEEMEQRMSYYDTSFDGYNDGDDDDRATPAPAAFLFDADHDPSLLIEQEDFESYRTQCLNEALASLDERSRDIVRQRWLKENKTTMQELAKKYHISIERIRQLEQNAIKKMTKSIQT